MLLTALVPFRLYILERYCFKKQHLQHLDPADQTQDDYYKEQRTKYLAQHDPSFDPEEIHIPNHADFRGIITNMNKHDNNITSENRLPEIDE